MREIQLIALYYYVCECYLRELGCHCQRFSNNFVPRISDQELLCIYLYCQIYEDKQQLKQIHDYAQRYLLSWFPALPAYPTFVTRLNRMSAVFPYLVADLLKWVDPDGLKCQQGLLDSLPIMLCRFKRPGKVGAPLADVGFCAVKGVHYWGLKVHVLALRRPGHLPLPVQIQVSEASQNDFSVMRHELEKLHHVTLFADKAYHDKNLKEHIEQQQAQLITPVKYFRGQTQEYKQRHRAADDLYSKSVAKIRQPIESLFNWLIEKTNIQKASKIRATTAIFVHIFGKIAAAVAHWVFNS